jgi:hypothetical protein
MPPDKLAPGAFKARIDPDKLLETFGGQRQGPVGDETGGRQNDLPEEE